MILRNKLPLALSVLMVACSAAATSPEEARDFLVAVPEWTISEVYVNDALSFKDGKEVANFGGVSFNRYMASVQFRPDGAFVGKYSDREAATILHWEVDQAQKAIIVTAADSSQAERSGWVIAPRSVEPESFEMTTETAAFDYPRVTRILLKFKKKE
ncbi:hypothetical protein [Arundinibacter roseus]|uniref:Lipocalin-like domain-containing protein n=1 Tax=Arundinibacter roseus TaxID=2070510 RepID=A0A4V2X833_9BACT|nr:hypothetical protein [Arundinibacter roseus]TDB58225.1 hypothetical protein EZE20_23185 [Arundinibacter roseus]